MAPSWPNVSRIVRSEPGQGTCETIYIDEHGNRWRECAYRDTESTTGGRYGHLINGLIVEN